MPYKDKNKIKEHNRQYYRENIIKEKLRHKIYREKNKEKLRKYVENWHKNNLRCRTRQAFKNILHIKKDCHTFDIIGLSPLETKKYIENKFTDGMKWSNMGKDGWEIDHIIPLSSAKTKEEMIKLCRYTNLQPLWWQDNNKKGNKILYD